jgi:hypothetical protein
MINQDSATVSVMRVQLLSHFDDIVANSISITN